MIGYDEDAENVYKRGRYFGVTAYGQNQAVGKTLSGKDVSWKSRGMENGLRGKLGQVRIRVKSLIISHQELLKNFF